MEKDIRFLVTNKCNYNCVFCHNEGQEKVIPDKELDVEDYLFLFKMFKKTTGYSGVTISGGEPFTFRNIDNLLKVLFEEGAKITVVTNGALLDRHFEALKYVKYVRDLDPAKITSDTVPGEGGSYFDMDEEGTKELIDWRIHGIQPVEETGDVTNE